MDQRMDSEVFFDLHEALRDVLSHRLGWSQLREVQTRTYRAFGTGRDVLVIAPRQGGRRKLPSSRSSMRSSRRAAPGSLACTFRRSKPDQ